MVFQEQIEALESRIGLSKEAASNLRDYRGNRVDTLDILVRRIQDLIPRDDFGAEAINALERVSDLTLLQVCVPTDDFLSDLVCPDMNFL